MGLEMVKFTSKHIVGSLHTIANQPKKMVLRLKKKIPISSCKSVKTRYSEEWIKAGHILNDIIFKIRQLLLWNFNRFRIVSLNTKMISNIVFPFRASPAQSCKIQLKLENSSKQLHNVATLIQAFYGSEGCGPEDMHVRAQSPVGIPPGRATVCAPPNYCPLKSSKREWPSSSSMSTSESMPPSASELWYQNSRGSVCLKMPQQSLILEMEGGKRKKNGKKKKQQWLDTGIYLEKSNLLTVWLITGLILTTNNLDNDNELKEEETWKYIHWIKNNG